MDKILSFINYNKPIYVYGKSGCGKTTMLKQLPYDVKFISIQDITSYEDLVIFAQPSILQKMSLKHSTLYLLLALSYCLLHHSIAIPYSYSHSKCSILQ